MNKLQVSFFRRFQQERFYPFKRLRKHVQHEMIPRFFKRWLVAQLLFYQAIIHFKQGSAFERMVGKAGWLVHENGIVRGYDLIFPPEQYRYFHAVFVDVKRTHQSFPDIGET